MRKKPWLTRVFCGCVIAACSGGAGFDDALLLAQGSTPRKGLVTVTGEFREDGSCQVFADGKPVFNPSDSAQTAYIHDATLNLAPSGFDAHELWCAPSSPQQPTIPPIDLEARSFVVLLYAPNGQLAQPRRYDVRAGIPTSEAATRLVGTGLFGMSPQVTVDSLPIQIGLVYLMGIRGTVDIIRVDASRVVAKFAFDAQPARSL
jgi:hypothetical protein